MSDSPYKFAIHSGIIYGDGVKEGWADMTLMRYQEVVKAYGLDPEDCISWENHFPKRSDGRFASEFVHLHPVSSGDYAGELMRAILMYEKIKARQEAERKEMVDKREKKGDGLSDMIDRILLKQYVPNGRIK